MKAYLSICLITGLMISCSTEKRQDDQEVQEIQETAGIPSVTLEHAWSTDSVFDVPESVCFDPERNIIYVSNIVGDPADKDGEGFISRLNPDGTVAELKWIDGLHAPKGMGVIRNFLYVADITDVVVINIDENKVVEMYNIPEAVFLNDISVGPDGLVYVSDSRTSKIHLIRNGSLETFLEGDPLNGPNGLFCEEEFMMLASSGAEEFRKIEMNTKEVSMVASGIGHGDGVVRDANGNYIVSNWAGQIFYITSDGNKTELLDTREENINSADIDLIIDENLLLIPTFFDNRVMAYKIISE
jgi:sugar lactone lactonase YvrE